MKKLFTFLALGLFGIGAASAQNLYSDVQSDCNFITGGVSTLTFPNTPNPSGDGTFTCTYQGDLDSPGFNEFLDFIGEGGLNMGQTVSVSQCSGIGTFVYTIPQVTLQQWVSNGSVDIDADAGSGTNSLGGCPCGGAAFEVVGTLEFPISSGPNEAGIQEIYSPNGPECAGDTIIHFRLANYGNDTLKSVTINTDINGVLQTPVTWSGLVLDSFTGIDTSIVVPMTSLPTDVTMWTSMPNGVVDTVPGNDTAFANATAAMFGTYTVGPSGLADFITIQEAVDSLTSLGVCGPTVFDIETGTYNEQIVFPEIFGASQVNTITFQSATQNSADVILTHNNNNFSANYTVYMDGADHVTWNEMTFENTSSTYAQVFRFLNGAEWNTVQNSVLTNDNVTTTSTNSALVYSNNGLDHNNHFMNNEFWNGSYGIYWWGQGQTSLEEGTIVRGNTFRDQYYMFQYFYYSDGLEVSWNDMESTSTYNFTSYGIWSYYGDNGQRITNNTMRSINRMPMWGMRLYYSDNTSIERGLVANNCIRVGQAGNTGSSFYGIYMFQDGFLDIVNNTISITEGGTFSRGLYSSGGGVNRVWNNSFSTFGNGYALYYQDNYTVVASENNNLYTEGNNYAYRGGQNFSNLTAWQNGTGYDMSGVDVDPLFVDDYCQACNDTLVGDPQFLQAVGITDDLEGTPRSQTTPDIGAVEFVAVGSFDLGDSVLSCGSSHVLDIGGNAQSVLWSTGEITNSITVTAPGAYNVTVVTACGSAEDTVIVDILGSPSLNSNEHLCADDDTDLDVGIVGASYAWSSGESTQLINVDAAGTYEVTVTKGDCEVVDTTVVTQSEAVQLPDEDKACEGQSITLDATITDGVVYSWTPAAAGPTNTVSVSDNYMVTVTDAFGCVSADTTNIVIAPDPVADFVSNFAFLTGTFTNITPNTGCPATYEWNFGDGSPVSNLESPVHVFPWTSQPQIYIVTLTVTTDCGTSTTSQEVSISTGVNELDGLGSFSFFPNPNNGTFTLELETNSSSNTSLSIMDLSGRSVYENYLGQVNGQWREQIQLDGVSKGVYFVKLTIDGESAIGKLIIQ